MEESKLRKCLDMENINYHLLPQFTLKLKAAIIFDFLSTTLTFKQSQILSDL